MVCVSLKSCPTMPHRGDCCSLAIRSIATVAGIFAFVFSMFHAPCAFGQALGQGADDEISLWRVGAALLLCLLLAVAAVFVLRTRMGRGTFAGLIVRKDRRLQLVEALRLSSHADLCIVRCDGRELLVIVSPHESRLLEALPPEAKDAERVP